jgi:hypothetical protein
MIDGLMALLFGAGMFYFGWHIRGTRIQHVEVPIIRYARWRCPKCERVKELPAELESKVLVCNNCNVRLEKLA